MYIFSQINDIIIITSNLFWHDRYNISLAGPGVTYNDCGDAGKLIWKISSPLRVDHNLQVESVEPVYKILDIYL